MKISDNADFSFDSQINNNFKIDTSNIVSNDYFKGILADPGYYKLDNSHLSTNAVNINELIRHKKEIDEKINNFLSFLEMKGIIKKDEFNDFLESLNVADKMGEE